MLLSLRVLGNRFRRELMSHTHTHSLTHSLTPSSFPRIPLRFQQAFVCVALMMHTRVRDAAARLASLPPSDARPSAACSLSPCLSVCVSVCLTIDHITSPSHWLSFSSTICTRYPTVGRLVALCLPPPLYQKDTRRGQSPGCGSIHTLVKIIQIHELQNCKPGRAMKSVRDTRSGFMYRMMCIDYRGI